ncbi:SufB/SufD family protein [Calditerricola satsumensis]|uniref:SufB/SufD family protein n=1 Tax=Calditerricola satsumensis TaxID=373054 RepID=UPI000AC22BF3|nr:SufD family Fe-S cluster assembly protein [Calditerricola satsumensis]
MSVEMDVQLDRQTITRFSQDCGEPDWMRALRLESLERAEALPLPKLEKISLKNWNFTRFTPFRAEAPLSSPETLPQALRDLFAAGETRNLLVQQNSSVVFRQVAEDLARQGVVFTDLATALREHGDVVRRYFGQAVKPDENKLTALHAALWSGGAFLYVPRGVDVSLPVQAVYWAADAGVGLFPHVVIVAEANSSVTYVENVVSDEPEQQAVHMGVMEIFVGPGARVRVASVRHLAAGMTDVVYRRAVVARDGRIEWILGEMGSGNTISENATVLQEDGACADTKLVTMPAASRRRASRPRWSMSAGTPSRPSWPSVMMDAATAILNGITKIEKGATKANGEQAESVLMLSDKARGDANPILLIDEDDVKAGHAASVGKLDELQLYYLMSRGISREEAERLLIHASWRRWCRRSPSPA